MARKRFSANDFKVVDATAVADWFEYTDIYTPGSSTGSSSFGVTTPSTNVAGMQNVIVDAIYNATPSTRTEWQAGPLQTNSVGDLNTTLNTRIAGEDIARGIMKTQQEFTPYAITTAGSYPASMGPCLLGSIVVQGWAAGTIKIYDNTSATGTPILDFDSTNAIAPYPINCKLYIGCYIVTSANTKVTAFIGV
jgi:hypothetical protein